MTIRQVAGLAAVLWLALGATPSVADEAADAQETVDRALATLERFVADPDIPWFHRNLRKAKGLLIVPRLIKGGLLIGGSGGTGVLLARDEATGEWSQPAFYTLGSVSFGLQIGAEVAEVAMMMMTDRGKDAMLATSFKLGGDVEVAAGPVGAGAKVATADVIAFSRAKGVYGGLSLEGSVVATRDTLNAAYYGRELGPIDILERREATNPGADALRADLAKAASD